MRYTDLFTRTRKLRILTGTVTLGASGAIASSACDGFSIAKTAAKTGRYTVTLNDKAYRFRGAYAVVEGAADTAYPIANGVESFVRNVPAVGSIPANSTFNVQFARSDTGADAEVIDNGKIYLVIFVAEV